MVQIICHEEDSAALDAVGGDQAGGNRMGTTCCGSDSRRAMAPILPPALLLYSAELTRARRVTISRPVRDKILPQQQPTIYVCQ